MFNLNPFKRKRKPKPEVDRIKELLGDQFEQEDLPESASDVDIPNPDISIPLPTEISKKEPLTLMLLDDLPESEILYSIYFGKLKTIYGFDIYREYKVVKCLGPKAGFIAMDYLKSNKIDVAILDITLGYTVKLADGTHIEYDGVDIAIKILEHNKNAKIAFLTAFVLDRQNPAINYYMSKMENNTNLSIEDMKISKNSKLVEEYATFFKLSKKI